MDGRPNGRQKAAFSNFPGVVWTGPKSTVLVAYNLLLIKLSSGCFVFPHQKNRTPCGRVVVHPIPEVSENTLTKEGQ